MSTLLDPIPGTKKRRTLLDSIAPESSPTLLGERNDLASLERMVEETGASTFLDKAATAGGNVLDILARPIYAVAGAAEEIVRPEATPSGPLGRAAREIFSGVGGIKGEKRMFGEVMEKAGVGPGFSASDVIPFLYDDTGNGIFTFKKGGAADPTARGALGFALDVGLDPLTYLGGAGVGKTIGGKALTKAGTVRYAEEVGKALKSTPVRMEAAKTYLKEVEDLGRAVVGKGFRRKSIGEIADPDHPSIWLTRAAEKTAEEAVLKAAETAPELLSRGGMTFMGHVIPGTPRLATLKSGVHASVIESLGKSPGGKAALEATGKLNDAMGRAFGWIPELGRAAKNLLVPGASVGKVAGLHKLRVETASKVSSQLGDWNTLIANAAEKFGLDPAAQKRVAIAVDEGVFETMVARNELEAATWIRNKGAEIRDADLAAGLTFEPVPNYLPHFYENTPEEYAAGVARGKGKVAVNQASLGRHMEQRAFNTLREGEKYGLVPLYDPWEALRRRGEASIKARNWRQFESNVLAQYGPDALRWNAEDAFDLAMRGRYSVKPQEAEQVEHILSIGGASSPITEAKGYKKFIEDFGYEPGSSAKGELLGVRKVETGAEAARQMVPSVGEIRPEFIPIEEMGAGTTRVGPFTVETKTKTRWVRERGQRKKLVRSDEWWEVKGDKISKGLASKKFINKDQAIQQARQEAAVLASVTERAIITETKKFATERIKYKVGVATKADKPRMIRYLSDEGKRHYFTERFARAHTPHEVLGIMGKYGDEFGEFFPKATNFIGELAPNGEPYKLVQLRGMGQWHLPASAADYVASLDRRMLDFNSMEGKAVKTLLDRWDWINNTFKLAVTAFPAFHFRNLYNNRAQSFAELGLSALDPYAMRDSMFLLAGREGVVKSKLGQTYRLSELKPLFEETGVIAPGMNVLEYSGKKMDKTRFRAAVERIQKGIGGNIENEARVAHAIAALKKGMSLDEAVASVNKALVNYSDMTDFERTVLRRIFPFWTWNSRNVRFQYDTLMNRPGLLANQVKPFRGRESDNQQMTTFEAGAMKLRLDGDGKTVRMITGVDLPIRNLDMLWRGGLEKTGLGFLGMVTPAAKVPLEVATGKSFFTGREFDRKESFAIGRLISGAPRPIQNWMGFKEERDAAGRPKYTFNEERFYVLFQSWALSRLVTTTDRQFREYLRPENANITAAILDVVTGLRYKDMNFSEEQAKVVRERERALQEALRKRGEMREFKKSYVQAHR